MDARITVVINTLNEEQNLPFALRSVAPWADEIVVVDMHSDDRTAEIAREYGAAVYLHERRGFADPARAFAIGKATGEWILLLDADELIPPSLSTQLRAIAQEGSADVVMIPREEYMLGVLMRYAWNPERNKHPRFFRRGFMEPSDELHHFLKPVPGARVRELPYRADHAMVHFAYLDLAQFLDKTNRYSTIEAQQSFARGKGKPPVWVLRDMVLYPRLLAFWQKRRATPLWAVLYAALVFTKRYLMNRGCRDGWRGFYLSIFWAGYFLTSYAKLAELETVGERAMIRRHYDMEAERILAGYETPSAGAKADDIAGAGGRADGAQPRITVVINTLNEEQNLPFALRSVAPWADEIVVVDMHSDDRTAEIAREYGAAVYLHERRGFADPARAFAIGKATGEWILLLDADELIPPSLSTQLREVAQCDLADGINIPRLNYFFGSPVLHTCVGPEQDRQMRFFKRSAVHLTDAVHDFLQLSPGAQILDLPYHPDHAIVHFAYVDIAQYVDKQNRYSTIEAEQSYAQEDEAPVWVQRELQPYPPLRALFRGRRANPRWAIAYSVLAVYSRYVKNKGYRDGWRGTYLTLFNAGYFLASYAKLAELETVGRREAVAERYRREAERLLTGYEAIARDGTQRASPRQSSSN